MTRVVETALVTGGAQRIGRAIVETLAKASFGVAIHFRRSGRQALSLAQAIREQGGRAAAIPGDLDHPEGAAAILDKARAALGPLTLLVNNASVFEPDGLGSLKVDLFETHLRVNVMTPIFLADAFASQVPEGTDASIVNMIDQRVLRPTPHFLSYTLSKAALHMATQTLAQALAPRGIRVNGVGPGPTLANARQESEDFARQSAGVPLGRASSPEDVAAAVLYLARARSVTGQMIAVDAGQHLAWETPDVVGIRE